MISCGMLRGALRRDGGRRGGAWSDLAAAVTGRRCSAPRPRGPGVQQLRRCHGLQRHQVPDGPVLRRLRRNQLHLRRPGCGNRQPRDGGAFGGSETSSSAWRCTSATDSQMAMKVEQNVFVVPGVPIRQYDCGWTRVVSSPRVLDCETMWITGGSQGTSGSAVIRNFGLPGRRLRAPHRGAGALGRRAEMPPRIGADRGNRQPDGRPARAGWCQPRGSRRLVPRSARVTGRALSCSVEARRPSLRRFSSVRVSPSERRRSRLRGSRKSPPRRDRVRSPRPRSPTAVRSPRRRQGDTERRIAQYRSRRLPDPRLTAEMPFDQDRCRALKRRRDQPRGGAW